MAYVGSASSRERAFTLATVAALHAGAGIALLLGLQAAGIIQREDRVEGFTLPAPTPTMDPPPITPNAKQPDSPIITPRIIPAPLTPLNDTTPIETKLPIIIDPPSPSATAFEEARPTPTPSYIARGPAPRGNPGGWATSEDYPAAALREGREGVTRFRVVVGSKGRVTGCEILASSGSPDLDAATCRLVSSRARFEPAVDGEGNATFGQYVNAIRWRIP